MMEILLYDGVSLCIQWYHASNLKLAMVGLFISQKLANAVNQTFPLMPQSQLLNIYKHTTVL